MFIYTHTYIHAYIHYMGPGPAGPARAHVMYIFAFAFCICICRISPCTRAVKPMRGTLAQLNCTSGLTLSHHVLIRLQTFRSRQATTPCLWRDPANTCQFEERLSLHSKRNPVPIVSWDAPAYGPVGSWSEAKAATESLWHSICRLHFP